MHGSDPPACSSHLRASGQRRPHPLPDARGRALLQESSGDEGFYGASLSEEELADLVMCAAELTLDDEIACTRVAVRRTLEFLSREQGSLPESDFLRAAGLVFQGTRTIARLLRDQQALLGDSSDRLTAILDAALDGLSIEWGIEL